jgi:hypothetical protein
MLTPEQLDLVIRNHAERIRQLEKHIHYPHNETAMKEAAARAQALSDSFKGTPADYFANLNVGALLNQAKATVDTAPMRSDVEAILTMTAFIKRLLSPEDFAYAVTLEVRNEARRALGYKEREV